MRPMLSGLQKNIVLTLAYTDQFSFPLKKQEIYLRLIGESGRVSKKVLSSEIQKLVNNQVLVAEGEYFRLKNSNLDSSVRRFRQKYSKRKWKEVDEFVYFVSKIPWVKAIVITGSLAVDNAKVNDDVDFMIITQEKRLWLARVLLAAYAFLKGRRRSWQREEPNSWCLNLWLDESSLKLPQRLENIYGAFEICQAIWVFDRGGVKSKFFHLNSWAEKFLPNYFAFQQENLNKSKPDEPSWPTLQVFLDLINKIFFWMQYLYMKPHMTREKVAESHAFFHPRDTKKMVLSRWLRRYNKNL